MTRMNSEIARTSITERVCTKLWAISGGRCELCNRLLYQDSVYGHDGNFEEMAHIHAVSEDGPRHKRGMTYLLYHSLLIINELYGGPYLESNRLVSMTKPHIT